MDRVETVAPPEQAGRVPAFVWTTLLPTRLLITAQFRIPYPFLPAISRGLGVPLEVASLLFTLRDLIGVGSPFFGYLSDRIGRKTIMLGALLALIAGAVVLALGHTYGLAMLAFGLLGVSRSSYEPTMQAYVSDAVPYARRGWALSITEFSWAGSWLVGVPLAGLLIARWDWRAPFVVIALLGVIAFFANARLQSRPGPAGAGDTGSPHVRTLRAHIRPMLTRPTLLTLAVSGLVILANESFFIIYGAWMETRFGLAPTALGFTSITVSIAELAAAILAAAIVDRLGKHRTLLFGLIANTCGYLLLRSLGGGFSTAMIGVMILAATSEFTIVSTFPLISELVPGARGTVLATNIGLTSVTAALASLVAPQLWRAGQLPWVTVACASYLLLAILLFAYVMITTHDPRSKARPVPMNHPAFALPNQG